MIKVIRALINRKELTLSPINSCRLCVLWEIADRPCILYKSSVSMPVYYRIGNGIK